MNLARENEEAGEKNPENLNLAAPPSTGYIGLHTKFYNAQHSQACSSNKRMVIKYN